MGRSTQLAPLAKGSLPLTRSELEGHPVCSPSSTGMASHIATGSLVQTTRCPLLHAAGCCAAPRAGSAPVGPGQHFFLLLCQCSAGPPRRPAVPGFAGPGFPCGLGSAGAQALGSVLAMCLTSRTCRALLRLCFVRACTWGQTLARSTVAWQAGTQLSLLLLNCPAASPPRHRRLRRACLACLAW